MSSTRSNISRDGQPAWAMRDHWKEKHASEFEDDYGSPTHRMVVASTGFAHLPHFMLEKSE